MTCTNSIRAETCAFTQFDGEANANLKESQSRRKNLSFNNKKYSLENVNTDEENYVTDINIRNDHKQMYMRSADEEGISCLDDEGNFLNTFERLP